LFIGETTSVKSVNPLKKAVISSDFLPNAKTFAGWDAGAVPLYSNITNYIEIHPEGILSPVIPTYGYQVEKILKIEPDIVAIESESRP
jgi:hypothetical protein